jgi:hypothetical protein
MSIPSTAKASRCAARREAARDFSKLRNDARPRTFDQERRSYTALVVWMATRRFERTQRDAPKRFERFGGDLSSWRMCWRNFGSLTREQAFSNQHNQAVAIVDRFGLAAASRRRPTAGSPEMIHESLAFAASDKVSRR